MWKFKKNIYNTSNTDYSFRDGFDNLVRASAIQSDGKILLGGSFTIYDGSEHFYFLRLNAYGTPDTDFNFNLGNGFDMDVNDIKVQADGKILVCGYFNIFNGQVRNRLIRLNSDGTEDTAFTSNIGLAFNGPSTGDSPLAMAVQNDGKILIGGDFSIFNDILSNRFLRLNADGTLDTAFNTNLGEGFASYVAIIKVQADGKILVGGSYSNFNGTVPPLHHHLVRLNENGTEDTAFYTALGSGFTTWYTNEGINAIAIQNDGKILVGGAFKSLNEQTRYRLLRLNSDGTEDTAFYSNLGTGIDGTFDYQGVGYVYSLQIQSDGKILVVGYFYELNGLPRNGILRLNSNGTEDVQFYTTLGTGIDGVIFTSQILADKTIVIAGSYNDVNGNVSNNASFLSSKGSYLG